MKIHVNPEVGRLKSRFDALRADVDASFGPEPEFRGNDRSQIYKALFKTIVIEDGALIQPAVALAAQAYPEGGLSQFYPMLHLPKDTSEQGNWHRDDNTHHRQVFWIPISHYEYPALSVVPFSEGILSKPLSMVGSRGLPLLGIERQLHVAPDTFYSWSSRFVHRGNLNTSDRIGAALVIFLDRGREPIKTPLEPISAQTVRAYGEALRSAFSFDAKGNIAKVDGTAVSALPVRIAAQIEGYFKIRTRRGLYQVAA
jgi:hypothetical protein